MSISFELEWTVWGFGVAFDFEFRTFVAIIGPAQMVVEL